MQSYIAQLRLAGPLKQPQDLDKAAIERVKFAVEFTGEALFWSLFLGPVKLIPVNNGRLARLGGTGYVYMC
jgi:hypothetical protein